SDHHAMPSPRWIVLLTVWPLAACGDTGSAPPEPLACKTAVDGRVTLVADDVRWDTGCLEAEPGELTIVVDNRDTGVNHNVHLPSLVDSPASPLAAGPSRQELAVALDVGAYEFICDIHPNMVGTLTVAEASPG
ncbi:MAG: hypothetical protein Q8K72_04235, partial [Acidimicrobiales bacterium]|nr:hypothetical protein [Acidimicrobiales bacterium]